MKVTEYRGPGELSDPNMKEWEVNLDGFATAGEAEAECLRLAASLLWPTVSLDAPDTMLRYNTPLPCVVYDRNRAGGIRAYASGYVGRGFEDEDRVFRDAFDQLKGDRQFLLALELFTAAAFERTIRARFVGFVSSLEPLAVQQEYSEGEHSDSVNSVIAASLEALDSVDLPDAVAASLRGRIQSLNRESVRQAYLRLAREHLSLSEAQMLDEAYNLRSHILHQGGTHPDLVQVTQNVRQLIRKVLSGVSGLGLARKVMLPERLA